MGTLVCVLMDIFHLATIIIVLNVVKLVRNAI